MEVKRQVVDVEETHRSSEPLISRILSMLLSPRYRGNHPLSYFRGIAHIAALGQSPGPGRTLDPLH